MTSKNKEPICNMDCFNCIHPDCINNTTPAKEKKTPEVELEYQRKYYRVMKPERLAYGKAYYQENREERLAYQKRYDQEHRKQKAANNREYRKRQKALKGVKK